MNAEAGNSIFIVGVQIRIVDEARNRVGYNAAEPRRLNERFLLIFDARLQLSLHRARLLARQSSPVVQSIACTMKP